jgi:hypothetical protein
MRVKISRNTVDGAYEIEFWVGSCGINIHRHPWFYKTIYAFTPLVSYSVKTDVIKTRYMLWIRYPSWVGVSLNLLSKL